MNFFQYPILYQPKKNTLHGHYVRSKDRVLAAKNIEEFVLKNANSSFEDKNDLELSAHNNPSESIISQLVKLFGEQTSVMNNGYTVKWEIPHKDLFKAISFVGENSDSHLHLVYSYYFDWKTKGLYKSHIIIQLFDNRFSVATLLHLPTFNSNEEFFSFISKMNTDLPFNLSPKNFRYLDGKRWRKMDDTSLIKITKTLKSFANNV